VLSGNTVGKGNVVDDGSGNGFVSDKCDGDGGAHENKTSL
jgi:hypothetical protein